MKELSIEEKARCYDERLARAKDCLKDGTITRTAKSYIEEIFPELKESREDEMIRIIKEVILNSVPYKENILTKDTTITAEEAIAWLEKQGEHAKFRDSIQVGDKVTRNKDGVLVNLSQLNRVAKKDEKQSEQKVTFTSIVETGNGGINALVTKELTANNVEPNQNWSEKDESMLNFVKVVLNKHKNDDFFDEFKTTLSDCLSWFRDIKSRVGCEVNCTATKEWSEEDKMQLDAAIHLVSSTGHIETADWLKSLKDRVQPRPKQEWSEEDKKALKVVTDIFEQYGVHLSNYPAFVHWLKTLPERISFNPNWRPNDEQMNTLLDAIVYVEGCNSNFKGSGSVLESLYNDLKKLREE